jgi:glycosyltransferase involved in cell wall biosynthesis
MKKKDLLVIMPAHNEAQNLPELFKQMEEAGISQMADVLVIDDASSDHTARIAAEWGHKVVSNVFCLGYGGAIQVGYKYAVQAGYPYVIQMDADGQHDPCNIAVIYKQLLHEDGEGRRPDIVLGSRYLEGSKSFRLSLAKRLAHRMFRGIIRLVAGQTVTDPTSGLQGLSRQAFSCYAQYNNFDVAYPDANMLMQMLLLNFRVVEVPAIMYPRTWGNSIHSGLKPLWYMPRMLFSTLSIAFRIKVMKMDAGNRQA